MNGPYEQIPAVYTSLESFSIIPVAADMSNQNGMVYWPPMLFSLDSQIQNKPLATQ